MDSRRVDDAPGAAHGGHGEGQRPHGEDARGPSAICLLCIHYLSTVYIYYLSTNYLPSIYYLSGEDARGAAGFIVQQFPHCRAIAVVVGRVSV